MPPPGSEDVVVKIAADVASASVALTTLVGQMDALVTAIANVGAQSQEQQKPVQGFWDAFTTGATNSQTVAVALGNQLSQAFNQIADGIKNAVTSLPNMVSGMAAAGDATKTMADRLGVSIEAVSQLQYVGEQSGVSTELMARSMQGLSASLLDTGSKSTEAVKSIGLIPAELQKIATDKGPAEALKSVVDQINATVPASERGAKMMEIFGARARSMTGLVKEDIGGLLTTFEELGGTKNQEALGNLGDQFNDLQNNVKVATDSFKRSIAVNILPTLNGILEQAPALSGFGLTVVGMFSDIAQGALPALASLSTLAGEKGIKGLIAQISSMEKITGFKEYFTNLGGALKGAFTSLATFTSGVIANTAALLLNPLVLGGVAIAATLTLLGVAFYKVYAAGRPFTEVLEDIGEAIEPLITYWKDLATIAMHFAGEVLGALVDAFNGVVNFIAEFITALQGGEGELSTFGQAVRDVIKWFREMPIVGTIINAIIAHFETMGAVAAKVFGFIKRVIGGFAEGVHDYANELRAADDQKWWDEQQKGAEATEQAVTKTASAYDKLKTANKEVADAYGKMTPALKAQVTELLKDNDAKKVAAVVAEQLGIEIGLAEQVTGKFSESLKKSSAEAAKMPLAQLTQNVGELQKSIDLAQAAGMSWNDIIKAFGSNAISMMEQASRIPGGLAKITEEVERLAAALRAQEWGKVFEEMNKAAHEMGDQIWKQMRADAKGTADAIANSFVRSLTHTNALIEQTKLLTMTQAQASAAQLAAAEAAAVAEVELQVRIGLLKKEQGDKEIAALRAHYKTQRDVAANFTDNLEADLERAGVTSQRKMFDQVQSLATLLGRLRSEQRAGNSEFDGQIQVLIGTIAELEAKMKGVKTATTGWADAFVNIGASFAQLGQIGGDTFSKTTKNIGEVVGGLGSMGKTLGKDGAIRTGLTDMKAGFSAGGMAGALKGISGVAGAIGGIAQAASMAIDIGIKMWDVFTKSGGEKVAEEVGKKMGVKITEEMGDAINKTAKDVFKGDRFSAEIFHMGDIIKAAGGVTAANFDKLSKNLRETFALLESGKFTADQAREVLDKNFGAFAKHVLDSGKVASKTFQEIIQLNGKMGVQSAEVTKFVTDQTGRLGGALTKLMGPFEKFAAKSEELQKAIKDKADKTVIERLTKEANEAKAALGDTSAAMGRFERLAVAGFNAAIKSGATYIDAIDKMGPALDTIAKNHKALGTTGGAAIQELLKFRDIAASHKDVVESAASLNEVMLALSNIGGLNVETMADLQAQGQTTYDSLIAAGFTEQQSLQQMRGYLEQVRNAHIELGTPIDENTQGLINQAEEQGILAKKTKSSNDIMMEGFSAIIEALGGQIPEGFRKAAQAGADTATKVGDSIATQVTPKLQDTKERLNDPQPWASYTGKAMATTAKIAGPTVMGKVTGAIEDVQDGLEETDWETWARHAEEAAGTAQRALDGVSFGESPGGIKEHAIQLAKSARAFQQWEQVAVSSAQAVKAAVDPRMRGSSTTSAVSAATSGAGASMQPLYFSITANAIDGSSMRGAFERDIVPMITDIVRSNTRGARTELRDVLLGGKPK